MLYELDLDYLVDSFLQLGLDAILEEAVDGDVRYCFREMFSVGVCFAHEVVMHAGRLVNYDADTSDRYFAGLSELYVLLTLVWVSVCIVNDY